MSTNITLDEKFTSFIKDPAVTSIFTTGGVTDDSTKMIILKKLFIRSGYTSVEMKEDFLSLKAGSCSTPKRDAWLRSRLQSICKSDKTDINTTNTVKFLRAVIGTNSFADCITDEDTTDTASDKLDAEVTHVPTYEPISEDEDMTDAIVDACLNYSKTCMAFMKMGYMSKEDIRDALLNKYLR